MERRWAELQAQKTSPWGDASVYDSLDGNTIRLGAAFDQLNTRQQRQVIEFIGFDYGETTLRQLLTPEEKQQRIQGEIPAGGAMSPYQVVSQAGRLVYIAYDGCTPMILLTERDRYSYYTTRRPSQRLPNGDRRQASESDLRNAGNPFWRSVQFSITESEEAAVRRLFWQTVGYEKAKQGWWIAWVPEKGLFEITIPSRSDQGTLARFDAVKDNGYRYEIVIAE